MEEEIRNEKELNISRDSVEKSISFFVKSLEEGSFNFTDLLKDKLSISIVFYKNKIKNIIQISNKSALKIFNLLCNNNGENFENILSDYITCSILDDNISYKDDNYINNQDITTGILEEPYMKLLEQTQVYKVSIALNPISQVDERKNKLLNFEIQNQKINIKSQSIKKICNYLNKTIYDMSDFINVLILYVNEEDMNKEIIQRKIVDKYTQLNRNNTFEGKKKYKIDLYIPIKNDKISINKYDNLFENILNKIDNIENNLSEFDDNLNKRNSNSEFHIPNLKGDYKNYKNKVREVINTPKKFIDFKIQKDNDNDNDENSEINHNLKTKCDCQKNICSICNVF